MRRHVQAGSGRRFVASIKANDKRGEHILQIDMKLILWNLGRKHLYLFSKYSPARFLLKAFIEFRTFSHNEAPITDKGQTQSVIVPT